MMGICGTTFITVLFCLVSQRVGTPESAAQQKLVYVLPTTPAVPSESSLCSTSECYSLKELGTWENFTSHTTIVLLPGTHTISGNDSDTILHIENVHDFSIVGLDTANSSIITKIECVSDGVFKIDVHNTTRLTLNRFEITDCNTGEYLYGDVPANIQIVDSANITIKQVMVYYGEDVGLAMSECYGHMDILYSEFSHNSVNCFIQTIHMNPPPMNYTEWYNINLTITDSVFNFGQELFDQLQASGVEVRILLFQNTYFKFNINITNITLKENQESSLLIVLRSDYMSSSMTIYGLISTYRNKHSNGMEEILILLLNKVCLLVSNSFMVGSNVGIKAISNDPVQQCCIYLKNFTLTDTREIRYAGSLWFNNIESGVIEDIVLNNSMRPLAIESSNITIQGECLFKGNVQGITLKKGSTLTIGSNSTVKFENNTCSSQGTIGFATFEAETSTVIVDRNSNIVFRNNTGSSSGAFTLYFSNIHILGNVSMMFDSNFGTNGGAISLYARSQITFCESTQLLTQKRVEECEKSQITFVSNHASGKGGGVYIDDARYINPFTGDHELLSEQNMGIIGPRNRGNEKLFFVNNTAGIAGNALYGEWEVYIDNQSIFNFDGQQNDLSTVSSNAVRVCMCVALEPNCTISEHIVTTYHGQKVEIEAVAVGQGNGTVPTTVHARLLNTPESISKLNDGQYLQASHRVCTTLQYTVLSERESETIVLTVKRHDVPDLERVVLSYHCREEIGIKEQLLSLVILFKDCPLGFSFNYSLKKCSCHPTLLDHEINDCDIETLKILKPSQKWINATITENSNTSTGVIVHDYCPFDFCIQNTSHISLDMGHPDDQCDFNRSGILCGACQTNFSHVFGTSTCKKCSNLWALLLVPAIALLGIALVILLISLNLTVSIGMINGLIFYANIVRANNAIFFTSNTFLSKFIAWLNLDLGFEVCFYNGLDAYTKTWLQLLFPVYIWALVLTIIILSHHYTFAARLSGTNAVQVLATLFLLSYAKLIRTIITILQPTMLMYPDGFQRRVWLYDGNVDYLKGKHIPLFIVALLVLVCLSIPYTTSLLFIQWLRKYNHHRLLRWVGKLKPLFDAYTGPLKEKHCYWFGLLLLVRMALYVVFSLNVSGNTSVNLMAIGTTTTCILTYLSQVGGVYESRLANLLLGLFFLNLTLLTMGTHFYGNTQTISATSIGIAFGLFVFIVMYHIYLRVIETKRGKQLNDTIKLKVKHLFLSRKVLINYFNPIVIRPKPVSHSSIQLQESLLGDD